MAAVVTILVPAQNAAAAAFDHAMVHRELLGGFPPLDRFSVIPYFIDPTQDAGTASGKWRLNHWQAHQDALTPLPPALGPFGAPVPQTVLLENYKTNEANARWWIWANHTEHLLAQAALPPPDQLGYPFW